MKYTIRFAEPYKISSFKHTIDMIFPYTVVRSDLINAPEEISSTKSFNLKIRISGLLALSWNLQPNDLVKVLFEYGKRSIVQRVKDDMLTPEQELLLTSENYPPSCPFDPDRISTPSGATIEVDTGTESLSRAHASPPLEFDVFISHASEDQAAFVEPLAHYLVQKGLHVWFVLLP
jgi:hypothetical protein